MFFWIFVIACGITLAPFIPTLVGLMFYLAFIILEYSYNLVIEPFFKSIGTVLLFLDTEKPFSQKKLEIKELWSTKVKEK